MSDSPAENSVLVKVDGLKKHFHFRGTTIHAVDGVSFDIRSGETLGLVGESGSGKSTIGRMILRLLDPTDGRVVFGGRDITQLKPRALRPLRIDMQLIPQDPYSALNPQRSIGWAVSEPLRIHRIGKPDQWEEESIRLLALVGVSPDALGAFPNEFSGGQLQRIGIARALTLNPRFLVCDEPVSALDVSIQAQVLKLLHDLQKKMGLTYLFISHNLAVVERISNRVAVMYLGQLMEIGEVDDIYSRPAHPYTKALLASVPSMNPDQRRERPLLEGDMPSPANPPEGCPFRTRCREAIDRKSVV